jgi:hypothetical protein
MRLRNLAFLLVTHSVIGIAGFAAGIYTLPILTAPPAPTESEIKAMSSHALYTGQFRKDLAGSDALHWGEGSVSLNSKFITLDGKLAPGPDYKLYLSPEFVETEDEFNQLKANMVNVGDVKTFTNFIVDVPSSTDLSNYNTVIIWCESFGEFITSAKYR